MVYIWTLRPHSIKQKASTFAIMKLWFIFRQEYLFMYAVPLPQPANVMLKYALWMEQCTRPYQVKVVQYPRNKKATELEANVSIVLKWYTFGNRTWLGYPNLQWVKYLVYWNWYQPQHIKFLHSPNGVEFSLPYTLLSWIILHILLCTSYGKRWSRREHIRNEHNVVNQYV